jgi:hypothetical protein
MSKTLPVRKLRKLIDEVQETMESHPRSGVELLLRFRYAADADGEVGVEVGAQAPVDAIDTKLGVNVARHWRSIGAGEGVLRIYRPAPEGDATAALEAAELALNLAASGGVSDDDMDEIQEALAAVRRAMRSEVD